MTGQHHHNLNRPPLAENGDTEMPDPHAEPSTWYAQPQLGRHASAGDQPVPLRQRQVSDAVPRLGPFVKIPPPATDGDSTAKTVDAEMVPAGGTMPAADKSPEVAAESKPASVEATSAPESADAPPPSLPTEALQESEPMQVDSVDTSGEQPEEIAMEVKFPAPNLADQDFSAVPRVTSPPSMAPPDMASSSLAYMKDPSLEDDLKLPPSASVPVQVASISPVGAQRPPGPPGLGMTLQSAPSAGAAAAAAAPKPSKPAAPVAASHMLLAPVAAPYRTMTAKPPTPAAPVQPSMNPPGMRELRVEDALLYLDEVKREFGNNPRIYNEFLAIMKNFRSQVVDTPGVISRVSKLFRGYNNLILGFNKFLPEGFKISLQDLRAFDVRWAEEQEEKRKADEMKHEAEELKREAEELKRQADEQSLQQQPQLSLGMSLLPHNAAFGAQTVARPVGAPPGLVPAPASAPVPVKAPAVAKRSSPPGARQAAVPQQAVEFDHAISYVTTIKRRFADDPSTYHAFLEILHTYQKEQRGIKEVLEQVAHLFQDHPDLLKEFTFFLPDAVQEQAKERLHRAAADSEARLAAQRTQSDKKVVDMTAENDASRGRKRKAEMDPTAPPVVLPTQPEAYVYNAAVERQFFDTAREALAAYTRDGGQAWAEFLKCLDMYAQEILSKSEMFNFVEPLLGKRNSKLFEEFKRIIAYAGVKAADQPNHEDSWYSVPLSEIDFSRCRRCTPSYRALPRDYPSPPCSDRSEEERKILNDVWVSLPVGSEESYTFRHMRRNTYEEILFRCEDERFEIDMLIDSNAVTLARLEPIAEEIAQLAENELIYAESSAEPKPASAEYGMAGKRFQYTFDKTILGVIHRNSISRIYGDAGSEMLDLVVKNPTVAIPLVVERLSQKDQEWKKVRARLNRRWKELAEHNYYRSLDHRSLTWRATDKRVISTRTLIAEIKDRAANGGRESAAAFQARLDKAKDEFGTFFEVTRGPDFKKQLDLTNLPKPHPSLFTPHMSFIYENTSWVHQDAYRILTFALERGNTSPSDKERCHRLWFDFLGPWFNMSMDWMMTPAVTYQETCSAAPGAPLPRIVSTGDESMRDDDDDDSDREIGARVVTEDARHIKPTHDSPMYTDHHPLPAGSTVCTLYGDGRVIECRRTDNTYVVQLPFGKAFLRPSAVLSSIIPAEKSAYTTQLRADDETALERPDDMLAIGTQSLYLFFRLHEILVERLGIAKKLAYEVKSDPTLINMVEQMPGGEAAALGRRRYDAYLGLIYSMVDGGTTGTVGDGGKYEDRVRALLGHGGYALATIDKLISHIMKNLQSMANDDTMWNLVQLYRRHLALGSFKPKAFRSEAGFLSDGEQMYAFQMCPVQKDQGDKSVLHMEYLGVISDDGSREVAIAADAQIAKRQKR